MGLFGRKKNEVFGEGEPIKCKSHQYECKNIDDESDSFKQIVRCSVCGWDRDRGIVCHICNKGNSKFKKNTIKQESSKLFHLDCKNNPSTIKTKPNTYDSNPDFALKQFDFTKGLERVIEITYNKEKEVDVKLFFSTDENEWSTFDRNYKENIKDNFIRLNIEPSRRTNSSLISGGNYNFNDDFDAGYSLRVSMKYSDKKLISKIASILRDNNFGCLPSTKFTLDAHRNYEHPTEYESEKILASITDMIYEKLT